MTIGRLGERHADARLVWAIAAREGRLGTLTHEHVEAAFPGFGLDLKVTYVGRAPAEVTELV